MSQKLISSNRRVVMNTIAGGLLISTGMGSLHAAPSGKPIRIGGTLSLTGPLAQTALLHKIAGETFVDMIYAMKVLSMSAGYCYHVLSKSPKLDLLDCLSMMCPSQRSFTNK